MKLVRGQERVGSSITRDSLQEEGRLAFPTVLVEETSKEWMPIIFFFFWLWSDFIWRALFDAQINLMSLLDGEKAVSTHLKTEMLNDKDSTVTGILSI